MARKILTIGITINLENYENLRLEVQGEVGADGNTEEIVAFLDGMLTRLGHGDQATAERVEAYRRRVLAMPGSGEAISGTVVREVRHEPATAPPAQAEASPAPVSRPHEPSPAAEARQEPPPPRESPPVTVRVAPEAKVTKPAVRAPARAEGAAPAVRAPERKAGIPPSAAEPEARKGPAIPPVPQPAAKKEPGGKPEKPPIAEGEVACEGCGLSITRNQEKLSRLLTGKSLCKKCMNPP
jgi:hypothetical protein